MAPRAGKVSQSSGHLLGDKIIRERGVSYAEADAVLDAHPTPDASESAGGGASLYADMA